MNSVLDNINRIKEIDSQDIIAVTGREAEQLRQQLTVQNSPTPVPEFNKIVVAGMGGSALAGDVMHDWLDLTMPFQVVKDYTLPKYVDQQTLVIVCSFSGNTEETLSALEDAKTRGAQIAIATGGGKLLEIAEQEKLPHVVMPYDKVTPRAFLATNLRAFVELLIAYGMLEKTIYQELTEVADNLANVEVRWGVAVPTDDNYAKQLALKCAGKTAIFYAGSRFRSCAYKWKIAINESAKQTAWCAELPEFNHNEFIGWTSHPIEKPFAVFDLRSSFDHPRVQQRFEISERLLSGYRPKETVIQLEGKTILEQMVYSQILSDYVSAYLGIINGVDPAPVPLVEKLKDELAKV